MAGLLAMVLVCVMVTLARAHDPGISTMLGEVRADGLVLVTGFAPADVEQLLPAGVPRAERWGEGEFEAVRSHLEALAPRLWEVRAGGRPLAAIDAKVELLPGDNVSFRLRFPPVPEGDVLLLRAARVPELPAEHRLFAILADGSGSTLAKKLLSARDFTLEVGLGAVATAGGSASPGGAADVPMVTAQEEDESVGLDFLKLGVEHIWMGYDHLLFLFALLIVCRTLRSIIGIITCFTLAHSLTLALATLDMANLPARLVEPLIAGSIVFVGVENLLRRGEEPRGRWGLTFAFGLIHGFGFAGVLKGLGVGSGGEGLLLPLFAFNAGVELGQIAIAAVVMPLVWRLRRHEVFVARGVPALSGVVSAAGFYWLIERTMFS